LDFEDGGIGYDKDKLAPVAKPRKEKRRRNQKEKKGMGNVLQWYGRLTPVQWLHAPAMMVKVLGWRKTPITSKVSLVRVCVWSLLVTETLNQGVKLS